MYAFITEALLRLNSEDYEKSLNDAKNKSGGIGKVLGTAAKVGSAAIAAATTAVTAFGAASVKTGMTFDSAMSQVAATMGTTVDQIDQMRDLALKMGSETSFSASEAADAMNILAMAGMDVNKNMETLPAILKMAEAGGLGIAQAADYATGIMAGFSNETLDAATIADRLAVVASSAKGDVASFGEGLSTVAGMANTTGQSMQDMTVALGILGNNNFSASEAGNALSRTLKNLYQPTDSARKVMQELGVSAYDAQGKAKPLQEVLGDLNERMDGWSDQAKNQYLSQIFDAATLKSVPALLKSVGGEWDELSEKIGNSEGAAERMADVQLDNLGGDITKLKSAFEGLQIAVSGKLTPAIRDFVQGATEGLSLITQALQGGGSDDLMEAISGIINGLLEKVVEELPNVVATGAKLIEYLINGIIEMAPSIIDSAIEIIGTLANGLIEAIPTLLPAVAEIVAQILLKLTEPETLSSIIEGAFNLIVNLATGIYNALSIVGEAMGQVIQNILDVITGKLGELLEKGKELVAKIAEGIRQKIEDAKAAITTVYNGIRDTIKSKIEQAKNWGRDLINNFVSGIKEKWEALKSTVSNVAETIASFLHFSEPDEGALKNFHTFAPDMMNLFIKGIEDSQGKLQSTMAEVASNIGEPFNTELTTPTVRTQGGDDRLNTIISLLQTIVNNGLNIDLQTDTNNLFKQVRQSNQQYKKSTGVSAFV